MTNKLLFLLATLITGVSLSLISYISYKYAITRLVFPYSMTAYVIPVSLCIKFGIDLHFFSYFYPLSYVTLAFWLCNPWAFIGKAVVPKHSFLVCAVLLFFSIWYHFAAWPYGVKYQGATYTIYVGAMNLASVTMLGILGHRAWRNPSFRLNLFFHWSLFAWFQTFAFAYLGELL